GAAYELGFRLARLQARLNRKWLVMLGPTLLYQHVLRLRTPRRLQFFLERRFVIVHRKHAAVGSNLLQFGSNDLRQNKWPSRFQSAIQVQRSQHSFKSVNKKSSLIAPAALLLSTAEAQV